MPDKPLAQRLRERRARRRATRRTLHAEGTVVAVERTRSMLPRFDRCHVLVVTGPAAVRHHHEEGTVMLSEPHPAPGHAWGTMWLVDTSRPSDAEGTLARWAADNTPVTVTVELSAAGHPARFALTPAGPPASPPVVLTHPPSFRSPRLA